MTMISKPSTQWSTRAHGYYKDTQELYSQCNNPNPKIQGSFQFIKANQIQPKSYLHNVSRFAFKISWLYVTMGIWGMITYSDLLSYGCLGDRCEKLSVVIMDYACVLIQIPSSADTSNEFGIVCIALCLDVIRNNREFQKTAIYFVIK